MTVHNFVEKNKRRFLRYSLVSVSTLKCSFLLAINSNFVFFLLTLVMVGLMGSSTPKDKNVSMLKSEKSSSHSWWWDSHNSPKCSKWLQSNLQDLDGKVKEMLRLIEEDADSFAQRAEMYYQKRPELINLVEEFYRAYRSLAERYDHLQGEIRQNIPRALQVQYGLSCDSPNKIDANKGEHIFSPLRKSNQLFESLLEKACQIKDPPKESDQIGDFTGVSQENSFNADEKMKEHDYNDAFVESSANSSDKEDLLSPSSSDSEVDNLTPFKQLQLEMKEMEDKNKGLVLSHMQALEINAMLQSKLRDLETGYRVKEEEVCELQSEILELNAEVSCLPGVLGPVHDGALAGVKIPQESLMGSFSLGADEQLFKSCSRIEQDNCHLEVEMGQEQKLASCNTLQEEVGILREENRMQKLVILASGEEKREVIRQLSISWEMLKNENQRLEEALRLLQNRLHVPHAACGVSHSSITIWKQLFALMGFKNYQPYVAVAL